MIWSFNSRDIIPQMRVQFVDYLLITGLEFLRTLFKQLIHVKYRFGSCYESTYKVNMNLLFIDLSNDDKILIVTFLSYPNPVEKRIQSSWLHNFKILLKWHFDKIFNCKFFSFHISVFYLKVYFLIAMAIRDHRAMSCRAHDLAPRLQCFLRFAYANASYWKTIYLQMYGVDA